MEKIKRFVECLIPVTLCNLKCSYCYVIQRDNRKNKMAELQYSPEVIGEAMNKDRWGGTCYFSICGAGETTIQKNLESIVYNILKNGHYVNITTNGTLKNRLKQIIETNKDYIDHLHFSFSFHYLELKRLNLIENFFENINMVKNAGASILVQINLCDEYVPYLDEIKRLCIEHVGAMPQVAATRKEMEKLKEVELMTKLSKDEYVELGKSFDSPLFDFTMKNFNKKRSEFCYAGDWTGTLNLATGRLKRCYASCISQNIFENPKEKIKFLAIGKCCASLFCMNSSHFMTLGVIPSVETPTYAELRNRKEASWYTDNMNNFLSGKLKDSNKEYNATKKMKSNIIGIADKFVWKLYKKAKKK